MSDQTSLSACPARLTIIRRMLWIAPALTFVVLMLVFAWGLKNNSQNLPSVLIGRQVPNFDLPAVQGRELGLSSANLIGEVSLVNVFASWCTACRLEHPLLMELAEGGDLPIHGLNYKDKPARAAAWLNRLGDPYNRTGADLDGRVSIDWGVYGVPETYVISQSGKIAYKQIGPISRKTLEETILPLVEELRRQGGQE